MVFEESGKYGNGVGGRKERRRNKNNNDDDNMNVCCPSRFFSVVQVQVEFNVFFSSAWSDVKTKPPPLSTNHTTF